MREIRKNIHNGTFNRFIKIYKIVRLIIWNSINKYIKDHSLRALSSVGRAPPFKEGVDGSSPSGLTINYILIGGYFIITSLIQFSKFSILFLLLGCVLKKTGGSLPLFFSLILCQSFTDSLIS